MTLLSKIFRTSYAKWHKRDKLARSLLGDNYITPEEMMEKFGYRYSEAQLFELADTLPVEKVLLKLARGGYTLIPGPSHDGTREKIIDDYRFKVGEWNKDSDSDYENSFVPHKPEKVVKAKWLAVSQRPVRGGKDWATWSEIESLLEEWEIVPNVLELLYVKMVHQVVRGKAFLPLGRIKSSSFSRYRILFSNYEIEGDNPFTREYFGFTYSDGVLPKYVL